MKKYTIPPNSKLLYASVDLRREDLEPEYLQEPKYLKPKY